MKIRKADFIIIGAQKSASTFLHFCIAEHPDVFMLDGEIPLFETPDYEKTDLNKFWKVFEKKKESLVGFKRPNYLGKPEVPKRIHEHLPNCKLIAVLRNPVDRAISACYHNINYGFLPLEKPSLLLEKIFTGKEIRGYPRALELIEFGKYYKYLKNYESYYKNGQLLILLQDDIKKDSESTIKKVYEFLNINSTFKPKSLNSRPQSVVYNLNRLRFLRVRNKLIYRYNSDITRLEKKSGLFFKIIRHLFNLVDRNILSIIWKNDKSSTPLELKEIILGSYLEDIECLEREYRLDLSSWKSID